MRKQTTDEFDNDVLISMAVRMDRHIDYNGVETRPIMKYEYDMLAVCPADPTKPNDLTD